MLFRSDDEPRDRHWKARQREPVTSSQLESPRSLCRYPAGEGISREGHRTFALRSMFKQENVALKNTMQMPQVKEWVGQYPGLEEQISAQIRTTNPIMRAAAFIKESLGLKRNVEMAATRTGVGMSI